MKTSLLALITSTAIVTLSTLALSSMAMAGGEGCDAKKGFHGKEMSAEQWEEFKKQHGWDSEKWDQHHKGKTAAHEQKEDGVQI